MMKADGIKGIVVSSSIGKTFKVKDICLYSLQLYPLSLRGCFCYGRIFTKLRNIISKVFRYVSSDKRYGFKF
jgi:hypothetical protein